MGTVKIDAGIFAATAWEYRNSKIPYSKLDCQAFVEKVLADCGVKKDWRGSNHMWRDALSWSGTLSECLERFNCYPIGAWLFTVKQDGGEINRGYHDNKGNAAHVGIFCGPDLGVMHSTTGGVQPGPWPDPKRWTHIGLCKYIDYPVDSEQSIISLIDECISKLEQIKERVK